MLVLSRKQSEAIRIGSDITIAVGRIGGKRVALAIDAPTQVRVFRSELREDPQEQPGSSQASSKTVLLDGRQVIQD